MPVPTCPSLKIQFTVVWFYKWRTTFEQIFACKRICGFFRDNLSILLKKADSFILKHLIFTCKAKQLHPYIQLIDSNQFNILRFSEDIGWCGCLAVFYVHPPVCYAIPDFQTLLFESQFYQRYFEKSVSHFLKP